MTVGYADSPRGEDTTSSRSVTNRDLVSAIIAALAARQDKDPAELLAELEAGGRELPVDSVLIAEILTDIEARYGVRIPVDAEAARSTRSVWTFAETVRRAIESSDH
jgi:acyl carrier protein